MLTLKNGHAFTVACASGALAYDGDGYWWEKHVLIPLGVINPSLFTIITKTITMNPRKGNMRWWPPCVLPLWDGGAVNAIGLSNPGLSWLFWQCRMGKFPAPHRPTIVSIMAENPAEAWVMARSLETHLPRIKGIEVNVSCPNIAHQPMSNEEKVNFIVDTFRAVKSHTKHPVGIKLGYLDPYKEVCTRLDGEADWFDLINTIRWSYFNRTHSPLSWFGYEGGVSGPRLKDYARSALAEISGSKTPIISGGGIMDAQEGVWRLQNGAAAVTIGTPFLTRPWTVNRIAKRIEQL